MIAMKLAMARQTAQEDAKNLGEGETRKPSGEVVTVKFFSMEDPTLRHTVKNPDGSSQATEVGLDGIRLTETAPDGTCTVSSGDGQGTLTVEHRDASAVPPSAPRLTRPPFGDVSAPTALAGSPKSIPRLVVLSLVKDAVLGS